MESFIELLKTHAGTIFTVIGVVVAAASAIVKITPSQKDDNILATVIKILDFFSVFNPNKPKDISKADTEVIPAVTK